MSPGKRFRTALSLEKPLQVPGTINAYNALLAKKAGYNAIYLSGAGVANASFGLPDLGITTLNDVLRDAKRITDAVDLPLLVDIDSGFGSAFSIQRCVKEMIKAGVAAVHIEDQVLAKRCGHRPGKKVVTPEEMTDRIRAATDARTDKEFVIMARSDALQLEGLPATLDRLVKYVEAGADMIFFEGVEALDQYRQAVNACQVPVLANITEFGVTPLFSRDELAAAGVSLILYPLSAFRVMAAAASKTYDTIRQQGTQQELIPVMQTRKELYEIIHYHDYEKKLDDLFAKGKINE